MNSILERFATDEPTICAVCHRRAMWIGSARKQGGRIVWLCNSNECHAAVKEVLAMPPNELDAFEIGSMLEAGKDAGAYLDQIGKTDPAALDAGEWREFLRRVVVGFEQAMRRKILSREAPF
jgi:Family of unknown function (DUF6511)